MSIPGPARARHVGPRWDVGGCQGLVRDTGLVISYRVRVGWRPSAGPRTLQSGRVMPGGGTAGSPPAAGDGAAG
jgi:hypothetical protein